MPKSKVRKIASMGGKAHAKKLHEEMEEDDDDDGKLILPILCNITKIYLF